MSRPFTSVWEYLEQSDFDLIGNDIELFGHVADLCPSRYAPSLTSALARRSYDFVRELYIAVGAERPELSGHLQMAGLIAHRSTREPEARLQDVLAKIVNCADDELVNALIVEAIDQIPFQDLLSITEGEIPSYVTSFDGTLRDTFSIASSERQVMTPLAWVDDEVKLIVGGLGKHIVEGLKTIFHKTRIVANKNEASIALLFRALATLAACRTRLNEQDDGSAITTATLPDLTYFWRLESMSVFDLTISMTKTDTAALNKLRNSDIFAVDESEEAKRVGRVWNETCTYTLECARVSKKSRNKLCALLASLYYAGNFASFTAVGQGLRVAARAVPDSSPGFEIGRFEQLFKQYSIPKTLQFARLAVPFANPYISALRSEMSMAQNLDLQGQAARPEFENALAAFATEVLGPVALNTGLWSDSCFSDMTQPVIGMVRIGSVSSECWLNQITTEFIGDMVCHFPGKCGFRKVSMHPIRDATKLEEKNFRGFIIQCESAGVSAAERIFDELAKQENRKPCLIALWGRSNWIPGNAVRGLEHKCRRLGSALECLDQSGEEDDRFDNEIIPRFVQEVFKSLSTTAGAVTTSEFDTEGSSLSEEEGAPRDGLVKKTIKRLKSFVSLSGDSSKSAKSDAEK